MSAMVCTEYPGARVVFLDPNGDLAARSSRGTRPLFDFIYLLERAIDSLLWPATVADVGDEHARHMWKAPGCRLGFQS